MSNQRKLKAVWTQEMSDAMFHEYHSHIWIPNPAVGDVWLDEGRFKYKILKVVNSPPHYEYPKQRIDMEFLGEGEEKGIVKTYNNDPSNVRNSCFKNITNESKTDEELLKDWENNGFPEFEQRTAAKVKQDQRTFYENTYREQYEYLKKIFEDND